MHEPGFGHIFASGAGGVGLAGLQIKLAQNGLDAASLAALFGSLTAFGYMLINASRELRAWIDRTWPKH